MDAASQADVALAKAQATAVYAGLGLWRAETTARLVEARLVEDGVYPNAAAIFADVGTGATDPGGPNGGAPPSPVSDFSPDQPRDPDGRWTRAGSISAASSALEGAGVTSVAGPSHLGGKAPDGTAIDLVQQTCADFIAANCKASILRFSRASTSTSPYPRYMRMPLVAPRQRARRRSYLIKIASASNEEFHCVDASV